MDREPQRLKSGPRDVPRERQRDQKGTEEMQEDLKSGPGGVPRSARRTKRRPKRSKRRPRGSRGSDRGGPRAEIEMFFGFSFVFDRRVAHVFENGNIALRFLDFFRTAPNGILCFRGQM